MGEKKEKSDSEGRDFLLELKDWISFLSSESYQYTEIGLIFFALFIGALALVTFEDFSPLYRFFIIILTLGTLVAVLTLLIKGLMIHGCINKIID